MRFNATMVAAGLACAVAAGQAQAVCGISIAGYVPGSTSGAAAIAATGCFELVVGGAGAASAQDSRANVSATADLATGVLTSFADAPGRWPSAALWDTITFQGLAVGGADVTTTLSLIGGLTGSAIASIELFAGSSAYDPGQSSFTALDKDHFPASVSNTFLAQNGVPYLMFAGMSGQSVNGTIDLLDPPTFSVTVPAGVTFSSASGRFVNVSAVPEPASMLLWAVGGLTLLSRSRRRA